MSYILDALNKAERERKRGAAPAVEGSSTPVAGVPPGNPWLWIALLAVVFNALLAGLLVWSSLNKKETAPPAPVALETPEASDAPEAATTTAASSIPETAPPPVVEEPKPVPPPDPLANIQPAKPIVTPQSLPLMTDAELQQQARAKEMEEQSAREKAEAPVAPPPEPPVAKFPPLSEIPLQIELRPEIQQALPPIRVDVHVYDDTPDSRFVMINLHRYHEGEDIAAGLRLERITKEGMVLSYRGERFRVLVQY